MCRARGDGGRGGATVLIGRCSQDEGAPALYPWASVLRELGHDLPSGGDTKGDGDSTSRFRAWESIAHTVLDAAADQHLLVLLDDLHWADTSTLRVLRLLAETAESGRLMVVATWRHQPPPTGQLAELAEMLARRHALRLELTGLSAAEASEIVTSVAASTPTATEADALRMRTDGNPFFLVEYARLAREGGDLTALLAEQHPPAAVQDVLTRRLGGLPEDTARALRVACVVGRYFDVPTLAAVLGTDPDDVLDHLDPALEAGLVREFGVDRFRFAHALVRDTAYAALTRSRRGRMHVRIAEVLSGQAGRENEVARHWFAAGAQHASRAWRAAVDAADAACRVYAYDEAVELMAAAVEALADDPDLTLADEYAVLVEQAKALQRNGDWVGLRAVVHRALDVSQQMGDLHRSLSVITLLNTNALWQAGSYGHVDEEVVAILRDGLGKLPPEDSIPRCRAMVSLASEIYYSATHLEREALCTEAVAMARRIGDPHVLLWALNAMSLGIWRPGSARVRLETNGEAAELARELGDGVGLSTALTLQAAAASELGLADELDEMVARAREQALGERHLYALLVLDGLEIPWEAMRGNFERVDELLADMASIHERTSVPQSGDALMGAILMQIMWGQKEEGLRVVVPELSRVTVMPIDASMAALLCRIGEVDEARAYLEGREIDLSPHWWFSTMVAAMAGEAAMYTGLRDLAANAYEVLSEFRGQPACAGSGTALGPVDAYLAMAAEATGERDLATQHAEDALRLCEEWRIPLAAAWFGDVRSKFGF